MKSKERCEVVVREVFEHIAVHNVRIAATQFRLLIEEWVPTIETVITYIAAHGLASLLICRSRHRFLVCKKEEVFSDYGRREGRAGGRGMLAKGSLRYIHLRYHYIAIFLSNGLVTERLMFSIIIVALQYSSGCIVYQLFTRCR